MSGIVESRPIAVTGISGIAGFLVLFTLLFLLSFVQRGRETVRKIQTLDVRSVEVPSQNDDSRESVQTASSGPANLPQLPPQPRAIPSRAVEPMPLSLQVDVTKVLEERDTLDYLISQRDLFGAFGSVRLEGVDAIPKALYLPPNIYPRALKERGIFSGKVLLLIEINEQGVGRVRRVIGADYPELVDPVVESVHGAIYSRPKRHGKPTRTIIKSLIHFRSGPDGDNMIQETRDP